MSFCEQNTIKNGKGKKREHFRVRVKEINKNVVAAVENIIQLVKLVEGQV